MRIPSRIRQTRHLPPWSSQCPGRGQYEPAKQLQAVVQTIILAAPNWPSRWQRTKWTSYGLIAVFIGHKDLEAMDTGDSISPYNVPGKQGTTEDN